MRLGNLKWIWAHILIGCFLIPSFSACRNVERPYEGTFLDADNDEPNLFISCRDDGSYDVKIGIFRLTYLDDGIGTVDRTGLHFTATDAAGNPIAGLITIQGDIATVTFTDSTWGLLETGSQFIYHRQTNE